LRLLDLKLFEKELKNIKTVKRTKELLKINYNEHYYEVSTKQLIQCYKFNALKNKLKTLSEIAYRNLPYKYINECTNVSSRVIKEQHQNKNEIYQVLEYLLLSDKIQKTTLTINNIKLFIQNIDMYKDLIKNDKVDFYFDIDMSAYSELSDNKDFVEWVKYHTKYNSQFKKIITIELFKKLMEQATLSINTKVFIKTVIKNIVPELQKNTQLIETVYENLFNSIQDDINRKISHKEYHKRELENSQKEIDKLEKIKEINQTMYDRIRL
jgi:CHAT domain-containing protein